MGKRNLYYLLARDKDNNEIVNVSFANNIESRLEKIDLFTSTFSNIDELKFELYIENIIRDTNVDLFIANVKDDKVFYQEVLCGNDNISTLAKSFLNNSIDKELGESVVNVFCNRMKNSFEFYDYVMFDRTNLYSKFTDYFMNSRNQALFDIKYKDGGWILANYHTLRNIVSTYDMFDKYSIDDSYELLLRERSSLKSEIIKKCEIEAKYYEGDLFGFSYIKK